MPFAGLALAVTGLSWLSAEVLSPLVTAIVLILGLIGFWLLVRKSDQAPRLPGWAAIPLLVVFVGGLFLASLMASIDRDLVAAGYWVWFTLWLQLGLVLLARYGRAQDV